MNISVVIPTYKNATLLIENLTHNLPFLKACEVIVVNDYPQESLKEQLKQWPEIKLIENKKNKGFAGAVNVGIQAAQNQYILLLNNDVVLKDTSYQKALKHFEKDENVFAVSFAQIEKSGETVGKNIMFWNHGFLQHSRADNLEFGPTAWAEGGSSMFDGDKLRKLNYFDEIYNPFYWEDIDLSYRAWRSGYTVLFDPKIVVEHHHESTIGTFFSQQQIQTIAYRNQFICIWKNVTDRTLLKEHSVNVIRQFIISLVKDTPFIMGFFKALAKKSAIMKRRKSLEFTCTDHEVLSQFHK